jgi:hypothetical protein
MFETYRAIPRRQALALGLGLMAAAVNASEPLVLPDTPSAMLRAPDAVWALFLARLQRDVEALLADGSGRTLGQQSELYVHLVLLAQAQRQWARVPALTERARRLQENPAGRLVAGVLNELLAQTQLARLSAKGLSDITRGRFAAMPWAVVGPALRTMHQQLRDMKAEHVENMVTLRLDPSASIAKGNVNLGFAMQLVGLRLQLTQVLPNRDALVAGLAAVLAKHPADPPAPKVEPSAGAASAV